MGEAEGYRTKEELAKDLIDGFKYAINLGKKKLAGKPIKKNNFDEWLDNLIIEAEQIKKEEQEPKNAN